jgi:hypothetical protein
MDLPTARRLPGWICLAHQRCGAGFERGVEQILRLISPECRPTAVCRDQEYREEKSLHLRLFHRQRRQKQVKIKLLDHSTIHFFDAFSQTFVPDA